MKKKFLSILILFGICAIPLFASGGGTTEQMADLVIQLGIIIIAAKLGGVLFTKIHMPSVLGELCVGIIIGPHLLGSIPLLGFQHGIFPMPEVATGLPVTTELYAISTIASILLLFMSGMETDLNLFLKYSVAGSIIGVFGVIASFVSSAILTSIWFGKSFMDPMCLFMGVLSTATSVGITARIFSDNKKMDSHEGVTILAAAVIDDVIGIILLAIIIGIVKAETGASAAINWGKIGIIGIKAFGVWLGATVLGMVLAKRISKFLKVFKNVTAFSLIALSLALLLSGFFEKEGLAMIIGAYVMGLTLSKTDLSFVIQDHLHSIYELFVPVFFVVMGMMVDVQALFSKEVLAFGMIYTVIALFAKFVGCGIPALFTNFNMLGATRIGVGMIPRGEVALIIAGIGLSSGVLGSNEFSIAILMTLVTTIVPPPILGKIINNPKKGIRNEVEGEEPVSLEYEMPAEDVLELVATKVVESFVSEGFYVSRVIVDTVMYRIRRNDISVMLTCSEKKMIISCEKNDLSYIKSLVFESLMDARQMFDHLKALSSSDDLKKEIITCADGCSEQFNIFDFLPKDNIIMKLKGKNKEEIITEMVDFLAKNGQITDKVEILAAVMEREKLSSTGMQDGIALPHAKVNNSVNRLITLIGIKKEGIDFEAFDGLESNIFVLMLSPKNAPHLQFMAAISKILSVKEARDAILEATTSPEIWQTLEKYQAKK